MTIDTPNTERDLPTPHNDDADRIYTALLTLTYYNGAPARALCDEIRNRALDSHRDDIAAMITELQHLLPRTGMTTI